MLIPRSLCDFLHSTEKFVTSLEESLRGTKLSGFTARVPDLHPMSDEFRAIEEETLDHDGGALAVLVICSKEARDDLVTMAVSRGAGGAKDRRGNID